MKRLAIAIDPSYVSKAGKKTAHIGRFWSGCTSAVKHGPEILGIAVIDADIKDAMMPLSLYSNSKFLTNYCLIYFVVKTKTIDKFISMLVNRFNISYIRCYCGLIFLLVESKIIYWNTMFYIILV